MTTIFEVLAEANRRRILEGLREGPRAVNELVELLGLSQPAVSKHFRVLKEARMVEVHAEGQRRVYQLRAEPLVELDVWLAPYRRLWEERLDRLEEYLHEIQTQEFQSMETEKETQDERREQ